MEPQQPGQYDFILNQKSTKGIAKIAPSGLKQRIIIVAGGALLLVVVLVIAFNFIGSSGKGQLKAMYEVAAAQQDLIDLTSLGLNDLRDPTLYTQAVTSNTVITSQSLATKKDISTLGDKKPSKKISPYQNTSYKATLEAAKKNGNYDDTYKTLYANRADLYRAKLQAAFSLVKNNQIKINLSNDYAQVNAIIGAQKTK